MSRGRTLLFLEDDRDLQSLVGAFLREKGYRVEPARSAAEARAVLARGLVDAAIVDGLLPGMTGADFIRELRQTQPRLPILFASAFWKDLKSHELLTRQLGVARILHKPYKPEELLVWVDQLFPAPALPPPPPPKALEEAEEASAVEDLTASLAALNAGSAAEILARTAAELSAMTFDGDDGEPFHVTFSAGIAVSPGDGDTVEALLRTADARLLRAKENGRNRIEA